MRADDFACSGKIAIFEDEKNFVTWLVDCCEYFKVGREPHQRTTSTVLSLERFNHDHANTFGCEINLPFHRTQRLKVHFHTMKYGGSQN